MTMWNNYSEGWWFFDTDRQTERESLPGKRTTAGIVLLDASYRNQDKVPLAA